MVKHNRFRIYTLFTKHSVAGAKLSVSLTSLTWWHQKDTDPAKLRTGHIYFYSCIKMIWFIISFRLFPSYKENLMYFFFKTCDQNLYQNTKLHILILQITIRYITTPPRCSSIDHLLSITTTYRHIDCTHCNASFKQRSKSKPLKYSRQNNKFHGIVADAWKRTKRFLNVKIPLVETRDVFTFLFFYL